ncbi:MAG: MerC domain-containing protein [Pseudobdellovibrionaceae bacterium]
MTEQSLSQQSGKAEACCDVDHSQHERFEETTDRWDKVGIFLSSLCAVHCLLTPILVLTLPVLGKTFEEEWVHLIMAFFVVPTGIYAFWSGYSHHKKAYVLALGLTGLICVGGAFLAPRSWVLFFGHDLITIFGSSFLITAHILNRRACLCHRH